jgi:hypothetical protein
MLSKFNQFRLLKLMVIAIVTFSCGSIIKGCNWIDGFVWITSVPHNWFKYLVMFVRTIAQTLSLVLLFLELTFMYFMTAR